MLGFRIFYYEMKTLTECTKSIQNPKKPNTIRVLQCLIGMFSYNRNIIWNFAKLPKLLIKLKKTDGNTYKFKLIITEQSTPTSHAVCFQRAQETSYNDTNFGTQTV